MSDPPALPDTVKDQEPEHCFDYAWKTELLERALAELKQWYIGRSMECIGTCFAIACFVPAWRDLQCLPFSHLCQQYGIADEKQASNMLGTVKRQFQKILTRHVRQTVLSGKVAEAELEEMFKFLKK